MTLRRALVCEREEPGFASVSSDKPLSCLLWGLRVGAGELVEDGNEDP